MPGVSGSAASTLYDESWEHVARKGKSSVTRGQEDVQGGRTLTSQIFGGAVQSTVKAARAKASVTVQPFNLLHLDLQNVNNVTAALQMLTRPEDIHGNFYTCFLYARSCPANVEYFPLGDPNTAPCS